MDGVTCAEGDEAEHVSQHSVAAPEHYPVHVRRTRLCKVLLPLVGQKRPFIPEIAEWENPSDLRCSYN